MSTSLTTQPSREMQQWTSPTHIKERITAIQKLLSDVLKPGTKENDFSGDYGIVPGTKKPSLWKSGSEQILAMFQIAVEPVVEDLSSDDCYRFRVTTRLTNSRTGEFLGAGVGEASTDETKYKWRRTYSKPEYESTDPDRRRIKFGQYKSGSNWVDTEEMQVRQEAADLANTVLKMAKKRSQIDATLTVTGASSMFEQDLEDLPEETQREILRNRGVKKAKPDNTGDVICNECRAINGHLPSCIHRKSAQTAAPKEPATQGEVMPKEPTGEKWLVQINAVDKRTKDIKDKSGKVTGKSEYRILTGINATGEPITLYAWDTKHYEKLDAIKPETNCVFTVKTSKSGDKTYLSLESIVEITGAPAESDDWDGK